MLHVFAMHMLRVEHRVWAVRCRAVRHVHIYESVGRDQMTTSSPERDRKATTRHGVKKGSGNKIDERVHCKMEEPVRCCNATLAWI